MEAKRSGEGDHTGPFIGWISLKPGLTKLHFDPSLTFKSDGTVTGSQSLKIENWDAELKASISTSDSEPVWLEKQQVVEKVSGDSACSGSNSTGLQWKLWQVRTLHILHVSGGRLHSRVPRRYPGSYVASHHGGRGAVLHMGCCTQGTSQVTCWVGCRHDQNSFVTTVPLSSAIDPRQKKASIWLVAICCWLQSHCSVGFSWGDAFYIMHRHLIHF